MCAVKEAQSIHRRGQLWNKNIILNWFRILPLNPLWTLIILLAGITFFFFNPGYKLNWEREFNWNAEEEIIACNRGSPRLWGKALLLSLALFCYLAPNSQQCLLIMKDPHGCLTEQLTNSLTPVCQIVFKCPLKMPILPVVVVGIRACL